MTEHIYETRSGNIHYWTNDIKPDRITLVMLPGLTADHHRFDKQVKAFQGRYNVLTWDAPGHGNSRPFALEFTLMDKSRWLHDILEREQVQKPVLIGQSMGGYVSQCFMEQFPGEAAGFVSIDSAPLKRRYVT
ncbi:MAG: alpha/beta hydrolase, partial [Lachnospiraceae bacterium]|nr:alpha/beta hydrolase [Lachnospiraceae bacterium]